MGDRFFGAQSLRLDALFTHCPHAQKAFTRNFLGAYVSVFSFLYMSIISATSTEPEPSSTSGFLAAWAQAASWLSAVMIV